VLLKRLWIEREPQNAFDPYKDSADVLAEMEDGNLWQARFVTLAYLNRELQLSLDVAHQHKRALAPTAFLALETPHVIADNLLQDTIEDVVDNLMTLGVFESVFAPCFGEAERSRVLRNV
jgi:hypothetical protein